MVKRPTEYCSTSCCTAAVSWAAAHSSFCLFKWLRPCVWHLLLLTRIKVLLWLTTPRLHW
jgi:hypothetical protein